MNKMNGEFRKRYRRCKMGIDDFVRFVNLPRVSGRSEIRLLLRKMSEIRAFSEAVIHIPICGTNIRGFRLIENAGCSVSKYTKISRVLKIIIQQSQFIISSFILQVPLLE